MVPLLHLDIDRVNAELGSHIEDLLGAEFFKLYKLKDFPSVKINY